MKQSYSVSVLIALAIFFTSCRKGIVYSEFCSNPSGEWHVDSVASFDYTIDDKEATYSMLIYVRHTERYPYQNMWLFVDEGIRHDTIEFYLADDRGQWLGNRHQGFIEMPVLYESARQFPDTGTYHMIIRQGMRDTLLRGVMDVGLEILKSDS